MLRSSPAGRCVPGHLCQAAVCTSRFGCEQRSSHGAVVCDWGCTWAWGLQWIAGRWRLQTSQAACRALDEVRRRTHSWAAASHLPSSNHFTCSITAPCQMSGVSGWRLVASQSHSSTCKQADFQRLWLGHADLTPGPVIATTTLPGPGLHAACRHGQEAVQEAVQEVVPCVSVVCECRRARGGWVRGPVPAGRCRHHSRRLHPACGCVQLEVCPPALLHHALHTSRPSEHHALHISWPSGHHALYISRPSEHHALYTSRPHAWPGCSWVDWQPCLIA